MIRNNQNRRRRGGSGPRPQQMGGGGNYGNRLDNRQRGNASQLLEKYRAMARDAQQAGDRVTAEYYLQYADHYYRVLGDYREKQPEQNRQRGRDFYDDDSAGDQGGDEADSGDEDEGDDGRDTRGDDGRYEPRAENRGDNRAEGRGDDNRGNWQNDRQAGGRERGSRDGNRDAGRDGGRDGNRERTEANREPRRDGDANREPRREGDGNRDRQDRQAWAGNRSREGNADGNRNRNVERGDRAERPERGDRPERVERPERRPEAARAPYEPMASDEGPIPGLPGPATLRASRTSAPDRPAPAVTAELPLALPVAADAPVVADAVETPAPRRRGRPRKVVEDAASE